MASAPGGSRTASAFTVEHRDGAARAGVLRTAHGEVRTPAFVPLASHATVRSLQSAEVAELGYDMVLGNTFHLFIQPGHEHIAELGGLHEFMAWRRPIVTDSGGFQVFSMGHGSVAEEVKRRSPRRDGEPNVIEIAEEGRALPLLPRRLRALHGAGDLHGDPGGAGLRCNARVRRVHALPLRPRLHRALDRAHAPLARSVPRVAGGTRPERPALPRHRPGRRAPRPARGLGRADSCGRGDRRRGHRWVARAGEGGDARGRRLGPRCAARLAAPSPARDRRRRRRRPRGGRGGRLARLRHADAARPPRNGARPRPRRALAPRRDPPGLAVESRSRSPPAARARPAASTPAPTCTTSPAPRS